jgi:hypothetical protein
MQIVCPQGKKDDRKLVFLSLLDDTITNLVVFSEGLHEARVDWLHVRLLWIVVGTAVAACSAIAYPSKWSPVINYII